MEDLWNFLILCILQIIQPKHTITICFLTDLLGLNFIDTEYITQMFAGKKFAECFTTVQIVISFFFSSHH